MTLFDGQLQNYRLYDGRRLRYINLTRQMSETEAEQGNKYFINSLCPHFEWKPDADVKKYTVIK